MQVTNNYYYNGSNYIYAANGAATRYHLVDGQHQWYTAPPGTAGSAITFTQAMTLDASGNLLVGTTSTFGGGSGNFYVTKTGDVDLVNFWSQAAAGNGTAMYVRRTNTGNFTYFVYGTSTNVGSISTNGTTTSYNISSDQRLKENIQDAAPASALIDSLQVREYNWKSDGSHQRYGFVAQELVTVAPEAVHQPADPEEMMAVDYSKLVPMLVKEIQSLRKRLAALEAK
jgi:hypothetical protein